MRRPIDPSPLFSFVDTPTTIHHQSPMERQRAEDGSPHTIPGRMCVFPKDPELYLDGVAKSQEKALPPVEELDPETIVKSYLGW